MLTSDFLTSGMVNQEKDHRADSSFSVEHRLCRAF